MNKKPLIIFIFFLAFIIRLIAATNAEQLASLINPAEPAFSHDSYAYHQHAINLLANKSYGYGFPTITIGWFQAPGYPIFLCLIYKLIGNSFLVVRIVQALIDSLTALIVFLIAEEIFDRRIGVISLFLYATYPYFIIQSVFILAECLFTFLYALSVLFIIKILSGKDKPKYLLVAGLMLAAAALTRSILATFLPFLFFWILFIFFQQKAVILKFTAVLLFFFIGIMPWILYSYRQTNRLIPISTTGAVMFWIGNSDNGANYIFNEKFEPEKRKIFLKDLYSKDENRWFINESLRFISQKPILCLKLKSQGFLNFWRMFPKLKVQNPARAFLNFLAVTPIPVLGILGLLKALRLKNIKVYYFLFSFLIFTLLHVLVLGIIRYRIPLIDPYLIIFASYFFCRILCVNFD